MGGAGVSDGCGDAVGSSRLLQSRSSLISCRVDDIGGLKETDGRADEKEGPAGVVSGVKFMI